MLYKSAKSNARIEGEVSWTLEGSWLYSCRDIVPGTWTSDQEGPRWWNVAWITNYWLLK